MVRRVVLGQSSLSCLCACSDTCRVVVSLLGGDFGRRREEVVETWRGFLLLESGWKFGWRITLQQTIGCSRFVNVCYASRASEMKQFSCAILKTERTGKVSARC